MDTSNHVKTHRPIGVLIVKRRWDPVVEFDTFKVFFSLRVISKNRESLQFLDTRIKLSEPNPVIPNRSAFGVDDKIVALTAFEVQTVNRYWLHISYFS